MRSAVVAVTPTLNEEPKTLERFGRQVQELQDRGLFPSIWVASVMHPDLYPYPASYYQLVESGLMHKNKEQLEANMKNWFRFNEVHMLSTASSESLTLAERLSDFTRSRRAEALVVNQPPQRSWLRRLVRRVAEVTAFSAEVPVLVLNPDHERELTGAEARILLAVDPRRPPSALELGHVASAAKLMGAEVHLVHVRPANRSFSNTLGARLPVSLVMKELARLEARLLTSGVKAKCVVVEEDDTIAGSLEKYAEDHRICVSAITSPSGRFLRRILLGSTARRLLRVSKRPVFVLGARRNSSERG